MSQEAAPPPVLRRPHGLADASALLRPVLSPVLPLALGWVSAVAALALHGPFTGLLVVLGFVGGFVSGLVGIGGGVVMIPLLIFVPPELGFAPVGMRTVTGITAVQVTAAALSGLAGHLAAGAFDRRLVIVVGVTMTAASLSGAVASGSVDPAALKGVFGVMALSAAVLLLLVRTTPGSAEHQLGWRRSIAAGVSGLVVGFPAGMVGVGGAFLEIPILVHGLRVEMRLAVGTALGIVAVSAAAGLVGKVATGQVDWLLALALVAGAVPAARLGSAASQHVPVRTLSIVLGTSVAFAGARLLLDAVG